MPSKKSIYKSSKLDGLLHTLNDSANPVALFKALHHKELNKILIDAIKKYPWGILVLINTVNGIEPLIEKIPHYRLEIFDIFLKSKETSTKIITNIPSFYHFVQSFPERREQLLQYLFNNKFLLLKMLREKEINQFLFNFPDTRNLLFHALKDKNLLAYAKYIKYVNEMFEEKNKEIFSEVIKNLPIEIEKNGLDALKVFRIVFKDEIVQEIFQQLKQSKNLIILILQQIEITQFSNFIKFFTKHSEELLQIILNDDKIFNSLFTHNIIKDFVQHAPEHAGIIYTTYKKRLDPNWHFLNPMPYVEHQHGPTCGYYALSALTAYWARLTPTIGAKPTVFYPARKRDKLNWQGETLKQFGRDVGLSTLGGIFDLEDFQKLIVKTGLDSEIVKIPTVEIFEAVVKEAIKNKIPIIFPHNRSANNHTSAHYSIITGDNTDKTQMNIHSADSQDYLVCSSKDFFARNDSLQHWPSRTYVKAAKRNDYSQVDLNTFFGTSNIYRIITEPSHDLDKTLKHKLLLVFPKELRAQVMSNPVFQKTNIENESMSTELHVKNFK